MDGFRLPREQFAQDKSLLDEIPDGHLDQSIHDIVAPGYSVKASETPLAGLPEEAIARAVDLLDIGALGYTAYWGSMTAEETSNRCK